MIISTLRILTASTAVVAGLALTAVSMPASAANKAMRLEMRPDASRTVRYWDLDLSKVEDAAELHRRITVAAKQVCQDALDIRNPRSHTVYELCIETAIGNAVHDVGSVNLTSVHQGHGPALASK